jgi:hypothetical protein
MVSVHLRPILQQIERDLETLNQCNILPGKIGIRDSDLIKVGLAYNLAFQERILDGLDSIKQILDELRNEEG